MKHAWLRHPFKIIFYKVLLKTLSLFFSHCRSPLLLTPLPVLLLCFQAWPATFTVINTNDSGAGSLRQAVLNANTYPGTDVIIFNISQGTLPHPLSDRIIEVESPSMEVTDHVVIQGPNQNGARIKLHRNNPEPNGYGFHIKAPGCTVRNLCIGNFYTGILVHNANNTTIAGNLIGSFSMNGNFEAGILLTGSSNCRIGGTTASDRNIISGNRLSNIYIEAGGEHIIQGNYIGVNTAGTGVQGDNGSGIRIYGSDDNFIGGITSEARNIISGNNNHGIYLIDSSGNIIQGNYIGTDKEGTAALPNDWNGIRMEGTSLNNCIGGTLPGMGNLISGNVGVGIRLQVSAAEADNRVFGNTIGANAQGSAAVANNSGIIIAGGSGVVIGGSIAGAGNLISGNINSGIIISGSNAVNNSVLGNRIGTDATGANDVGNGQDGIVIDRASTSIIGGMAVEDANIIAYNGRHGILIGPWDSPAPQSRQNAIRGNSIFANADIGIRLSLSGVTPNDPGDTDTGPNELQNYPVLSTVQIAPGQTIISGTLNSQPEKTYSVDIYRNESCDPSGYGQGQYYLGSVQTTTNGGGDTAFQMALPMEIPRSSVLTATATDPDGNTSEFSTCYIIANQGAIMPGIQLLLLGE